MNHAPSHDTDGLHDKGGWGLLGLTAGIVGGAWLSFQFLVPLFPKDKGTLNLTLMTTIMIAAMTIGGAAGYLGTRRRQ